MHKNYLIVIDMQYDFVYGSLGSEQARSIVEKVKNKILNFKGEIIFTRDTHSDNYLQTLEGVNLPVIHCLKDTDGWQIIDEISKSIDIDKYLIFDKSQFGSIELAGFLENENKKHKIDKIEMIGLCTDICVVNNAMLLKTFLPETKIIVDSDCCAGTTQQMHNEALNTMRSCQILIDKDL